MTIMYLTFGNKIEYHIQAYFSMLSFRKQLSKDDHIAMVTTCPNYYRKASEWIDVLSLDKEQVKEWEGAHHYKFRVKTMAMKQYVESHPQEHLLFVDTDTFLYGNLNDIRNLLDQGKAIMHKDEGHPSHMKGPSLRMWKTLEGKEFAGIKINERHNMWNSGIIGIPAQKTQAVTSHTLQLLDDMLEKGVTSFNIEQYAMSIAMTEHLHLEEATSLVGHYWGNKETWERIACELLLRSYMQMSNIDEEMNEINNALFHSEPIFIHKSNTANRLKKMIDKIFKDKDQKYI